jgi:hypothetical protein
VGADLLGELAASLRGVRVGPDAVHAEQPVARLQHLRGREALLHLVHADLRLADGREVEEEQHQRDHEVHRRARGDHHDPLPDRLRVVGAVAHVLRQVVVRVHAGDLHVAPERDHAERVLGLAPGLAPDERREEEREALRAHADRLGRGEVPGLVEHDQQREADEGEDPAHARTPAAASRAASSAR